MKTFSQRNSAFKTRTPRRTKPTYKSAQFLTQTFQKIQSNPLWSWVLVQQFQLKLKNLNFLNSKHLQFAHIQLHSFCTIQYWNIQQRSENLLVSEPATHYLSTVPLQLIVPEDGRNENCLLLPNSCNSTCGTNHLLPPHNASKGAECIYQPCYWEYLSRKVTGDEDVYSHICKDTQAHTWAYLLPNKGTEANSQTDKNAAF